LQCGSKITASGNARIISSILHNKNLTDVRLSQGPGYKLFLDDAWRREELPVPPCDQKGYYGDWDHVFKFLRDH
jgi:hypothetical protein